MNQLTAVVKGDRSPGLYQVTQELSIDELATLCQQYDTQLFYIDGEAVSNKAEFLQVSARAMGFPDYFGDNWDAFEDMLTDLEWIVSSRYLVLYTHPEPFAQADAGEWATAIDIFQSAVDYWADTETPLYVLLNPQSSLSDEIAML